MAGYNPMPTVPMCLSADGLNSMSVLSMCQCADLSMAKIPCLSCRCADLPMDRIPCLSCWWMCQCADLSMAKIPCLWCRCADVPICRLLQSHTYPVPIQIAIILSAHRQSTLLHCTAYLVAYFFRQYTPNCTLSMCRWSKIDDRQIGTLASTIEKRGSMARIVEIHYIKWEWSQGRKKLI